MIEIIITVVIIGIGFCLLNYKSFNNWFSKNTIISIGSKNDSKPPEDKPLFDVNGDDLTGKNLPSNRQTAKVGGDSKAKVDYK